MLTRTLAIGLCALALSTSAIAQVDPFNLARNQIQSFQNSDALALIDSGKFEVNQQTGEGYSLLHYAAGAGNLDMVKALIARGANPTLKAATGTTPYQMAVGTMVQAELRKAMAAGASAPPAGAPGQAAAAPRAPAPVAKVAGPASNGMCAMVRAEKVNDGRSPAQRPFLKAKDAVWYNHPDELVGLLDDCVGINDLDQYGWTLLHHAASRDRIDIARTLVNRGASRTIRNKDGETAATLATSPQMKALLGPATAVKADTVDARRKLECRQKYEADAALASGVAAKMSANRRWEQCLKTGLYW